MTMTTPDREHVSAHLLAAHAARYNPVEFVLHALAGSK